MDWKPNQAPLAVGSGRREKRVKYPDARPGNLVWMGRHKQLGILQKNGRVKNANGIVKCSSKDLWYPYPDEKLDKYGFMVAGDK
jgi:hypothetical protein